jgi:hypothetical protein
MGRKGLSEQTSTVLTYLLWLWAKLINRQLFKSLAIRVGFFPSLSLYTYNSIKNVLLYNQIRRNLHYIRK